MSLVRRAATLFDEILVAIADNSAKKPLFSTQERLEMAEDAISGIKNSKVIVFKGLLADLVEREECCAIIRGLRAVSDFEYEFQMALMNRKMSQQAETVFLMPSLNWVYLSSSIVKEVARHGGEIKTLVPKLVGQKLKERFGNED
jgi:pantetheine-phosphate adenylyltransferase